MTQDVKVLVVSFHHEAILLGAGVRVTSDCGPRFSDDQSILERHVCKAHEAVRVILVDVGEHMLEFVASLSVSAHFEQQLALETVLVDGCANPTLCGLVDPVKTALVVATIACQVGESMESVDVVWLLLDDLLVEVISLIELMKALMQVSRVEHE